MEKTIKIGDKEYLMRSSAYTQFAYKNETGRSFVKDLTEIANKYQDLKVDSMDSKELLNRYDDIEDIISLALRIAYIMGTEAKSITGSFEDFLKGINNYIDNIDWLMDVILLGISPLSGNIQASEK